MAHAIYSADASPLIRETNKAISIIKEMGKLKTEALLRAKFNAASMSQVRAQVHAGAAAASRDLYLQIKARIIGIAEAKKQMRDAFAQGVMAKITPYVSAAALASVKEKIGSTLKVSALEVGVKFQSGAAGRFRETVKAMLRVLSRSSFVEAELRLRGAGKVLDGLKNKKVLFDVDVKPGTAAKIKALLELLKKLKEGAKVPIKLDVEPGLMALLRTLGRDLKRAADEAERLDRRLNGAAGAAGNAGQAAGAAGGRIAQMRQSIASFASSIILVQGLHAAFATLKDSIIDYPALLETANVGMTRMFDGNKKKAAEMMSALENFAIPTPFATRDLIPKANQALAFGLVDSKSKDAVKEMIGLLTDVGDAAFGLGRGQEGVDRMLLAFGQMRSATRVTGNDMLQLQALGINAWDYLAKATGKTTGEVRDLVSKGLIPAKEGIEAIRAGLRGRFAGGMEDAAKTFAGAVAQLKDTTQAKLKDFFAPQFKQLSEFAQKAAQVLGSREFDRWLNAFAARVEETFAFIIGIYDGFVEQVRIGNPVLLGTLAILGARFLWLANAAIGRAVYSAGISLGRFAGSILALPAPLLIAIAAAVAFGIAYKKNFGGVADYTNAAVNFVIDSVKTLSWAVGKAVESVSALLNKIPDIALVANPALLSLKHLLGDQTGLADGLLGDFDAFDARAHKFRTSLESAFNIDNIGAEVKSVIGNLLPNIQAALNEKPLTAPPIAAPPGGIPHIATPDAPDKAKDKAAKDAARAAAKEKALALRREKDALADMATVYDRNAKAFEATAKAVADGAKRQIDVLTGVRDSVRDVIGDMQSQFVALGIINDPLAPLIRDFERVLNLSGKSSKLIGDTKAQIAALDRLASTERGKANAAKSRQERLSGLDGNVPGGAQNAGRNSDLAGGNIGNRIADAAVAMQRKYGDRIGTEFYRQCDRLADRTVNSATSIYNRIMGPMGKGDSAARTMARFKRAGIGAAPNGQYAAGDIGYSGATKKNRAGHVQIRGRDGQWYDQYGAHQKSTTPIQWVVRSGGASAATAPSNSARAAKKGASGAANGVQSADASRTEFDATPLDDGLAKFAAIDKAWGSAVKNTENNSQRFALQSRLATKEFQAYLAEQAAAAGKTIPQMVQWYRNFSNTADYLLNAARATDAVTASIKELKAQRAALGTENNPLIAILKEFEPDGQFARALDGADALLKKARAIRAQLATSDAKRTPSAQKHLEQQAFKLEQDAQKVTAQRGDKLREQAGFSLDQVTKSTKEATDAEADRIAVLARARGAISQATAGTDAYDRALEKANREFEVWRSPDIRMLLEMRDTFFGLAQAAREAGAAAGLSPQDKAGFAATARAYGDMGQRMSASANSNAQTRIKAGVGSTEQGRIDKRDIGVAEFDRNTADAQALALKEREILLNNRLDEQAKEAALAREKFLSDTRAQLRSGGYTDGTNNTIDAAGIEATRRADATDFRAGAKTSAINDYNAAMLEAQRAQSGFADSTLLAAQKWELAQGKLQSLTETQKANYLISQAQTLGSAQYGAQRDALQSQALQTRIELEGRVLALGGQVGPLAQQELKWKQEDIETSRKLKGLTDEQRGAYEAQRPAVMALRDDVRALFKESEKVAAAEWFKGTKRSFDALIEPDEITRGLTELRAQLEEQGFSKYTIDAILNASQVYSEAARTVGRLREFVGQMQGVFETGFKAAEEKGPKEFFASVINGMSDMVADVSRKLLSAALTNLFMKAFPRVAGVFDETATATDKMNDSTMRNAVSVGGLAVAYNFLTASVKAYTAAAQAAGTGGGDPTAGAASGILGGLFGGDNGIFAGLLGGSGSGAAGVIPALATSTGPGGGISYAAIGEKYVQNDGSRYILHRGEGILTARENELYRGSIGRGAPYGGAGSSGSGTVNITNVFNITESKSARDTAAQVGRHVEQTMSRRAQQQSAYDGIAPGGRQR